MHLSGEFTLIVISSIVTMTLSTLGALMRLVLISSWKISGGFLALVPVLMRQQIRVHPTNIFVLLINFPDVPKFQVSGDKKTCLDGLLFLSVNH